MEKKKKPDESGQLKLKLTFTAPHPAVVRMAEMMTELADAPKPKGKAREGSNLRQIIRKHALIVAVQENISPHVVWVLAYHELFARTGFHAVIESAEGHGSHLDAVFNASKKRLIPLPQALLGVLGDFLRDGTKACQ